MISSNELYLFLHSILNAVLLNYVMKILKSANLHNLTNLPHEKIYSNFDLFSNASLNLKTN